MVHTDLIFAMVCVGTGLGLYFWSGRKTRLTPSRLRLGFGNSRASSVSNQISDQKSSTKDKVGHEVVSEMSDLNLMLRSKNLNVVFMYNGHNWDAYEVLGVPAGSSFETIQKGYQDCRQKTNSQSHDFIDCAYQAIVQDLKRCQSSNSSSRKRA